MSCLEKVLYCMSLACLLLMLSLSCTVVHIRISTKLCCCLCSDKWWHLKTVCNLCRKLMPLNHVELKIIWDSDQWCSWCCLISGERCASTGTDSFSLYPMLWLLSPGRRWYGMLLGPLSLRGKVTLARIFHISSPLSFLSPLPPPPLFFFIPHFGLNCLCLSCWLNCQVSYSNVLIQVNASDCPLFFMFISSYGLLSNGFWNVA